jgi:hypothetical protein
VDVRDFSLGVQQARANLFPIATPAAVNGEGKIRRSSRVVASPERAASTSRRVPSVVLRSRTKFLM